MKKRVCFILSLWKSLYSLVLKFFKIKWFYFISIFFNYNELRNNCVIYMVFVFLNLMFRKFGFIEFIKEKYIFLNNVNNIFCSFIFLIIF